EEASSRPLLLVIDNAHEIADAERSLELLEWVIESLPMGSELILSTRRPLQMASLDRRLLGGEMLVLGSGDLAFTVDEIEELTTARSSVLLPHETHAATDGWPIAVAGALNGTLSLNGAAGAVA